MLRGEIRGKVHAVDVTPVIQLICLSLDLQKMSYDGMHISANVRYGGCYMHTPSERSHRDVQPLQLTFRLFLSGPLFLLTFSCCIGVQPLAARDGPLSRHVTRYMLHSPCPSECMYVCIYPKIYIHIYIYIENSKVRWRKLCGSVCDSSLGLCAVFLTL